MILLTSTRYITVTGSLDATLD